MNQNKIFPLGGTNNFEFICRRYDEVTSSYAVHDVSSATEIIAYIVDRKQPSTTLTKYTCSPLYYFADWANGIITGEFDNSETSKITHLGYANLVIKATLAGEPEYFYSEDKALLLISTPS
jgi:hypothetical protein